jgi:hypothetical protein
LDDGPGDLREHEVGRPGGSRAGRAGAPTSIGIERTIDSIRQAWSRPGARPEPNAEGWDSLFNCLLEELQAYTRALSPPNSRVSRGKFAAGVADLHLPVDAALGAVDVG